MPTATILGYWAGDGTTGTPYRPEIIDRYAIDTWTMADDSYYASGILLVTVTHDEQAVIDAIVADAGVIPDAQKLSPPALSPLTVPDDPVDLDAALAALEAGGTLELPQGIYHLASADHTVINPGGTVTTTIKAQTGARVILTADDDEFPPIIAGPYVRFENIWFGGGVRDTGRGVSVAAHTSFYECVFFNTKQACSDGANTTYSLYERCVFLRAGYMPLDHPIYIAGHESYSVDKYTEVKECIFIDCISYPLQVWHNAYYVTTSHNLIDSENGALSNSGNYNNHIGNIFWRAEISATVIRGSDNTVSDLLVNWPVAAAYDTATPLTNTRWLSSKRAGNAETVNDIVLEFGALTTLIGMNYANVSEAVAALTAIFAGALADVITDNRIDYYVGILQSAIDNYKSYLAT